MFAPILRLRLVLLVILLSVCSSAQRTGPGKTPINSSSTAPSVAPVTRPVFVYGNVLVEGGGAPPESVAIERVCNGLVRRVGYTDSKGEFQLDLGAATVQDSSENDTAGGLSSISKPAAGIQSRYEGCELVAVLPGYRSTSVTMHSQDDFGQNKVGTIILKRLGNVEGSTISTTSMAAPKDARQSYEKARKARAENKLPEAEQHANKAVTIYPNYAVAWALLGEVYFLEAHFDDAEKAYSRAKNCDAQYVTPYFGLTMIASNRKRWEEAAAFAEQTIRLNAYAFPTAYFYSALANYNLKKLDVAEQSARKFQAVDTEHRHPDVALLISQILTEKGDLVGAAQQLRAYLAAVPNAENADQVRAHLQRLEAMTASPPK